MTTDIKANQIPAETSAKAASKKKRILPRAGKHESLEESLKRINEQYGEALRRLAQ
jgi:hypothetical protein